MYHLTCATVNTNTILGSIYISNNCSWFQVAHGSAVFTTKRECSFKVNQQVEMDLIWRHRKLAVLRCCDC